MEALTDEDPSTIGGYELRGRLGEGGFGVVYLGLSPAGRAVAVKVLQRELARDAEFLRRFQLEVTAAKQVSGIYTAPVVASGLDERPPWVATVFVPGPPLDQVVAGHGALPEPALWRLLAGLVEALQAIHGSGLVHRDLKPANVMLASDGPRVIDFGISKALDAAAAVTSTGMIVGTAAFMAPEQAEGQEVGTPADVFSLGCVLAYAATGTPPFGGGTTATILYRVVHRDPDLDRVPPRLRGIIEKCLAKDPADRPALAELASLGRDGPADATPSAWGTAFWPPPIGQVIRDYQDQFDGERTARADEPGSAPGGGTAVTIRPTAVPDDSAAREEPAGPGEPAGRSRRPRSIASASALMIAGAVLALASTLAMAVGFGAAYTTSPANLLRVGYYHFSTAMLPGMTGYLIEAATWLGVALAVRAGRGWTRVVGTIFFGFLVILAIGYHVSSAAVWHVAYGFAFTGGASAASLAVDTLGGLLTIGSVVIGAIAVELLWERSSAAYFGRRRE
jgi:hypothetical protein